ncbi:MAG: proprotein convertase P-domain-containing protein [Promethearchaeota archaeon]
MENRSSLFGIIAIIIGASGLGIGAYSVVNFQTVEGTQGPPGNDGQDAPGGLVVGILDPDHHDTIWGEIEIRALVYGSNNYSVSVKANSTEIGTQLPTFWNASLEVEGWYNLTVIITDNETKITASDTVWILIDNPVSSEKDITSYYFPKWANPDLPSSIVASIVGTWITALLPEGSNVSELVASFTTTGAAVEVNNVEQISDITVNDFNDDLISYVVFAEDGSTKTYNVAVMYRKPVVSTDTPVGIPDAFLGGVSSVITMPDLGVCYNLSVFVDILNSDIGTIEVSLSDPDGVEYTLYDSSLSGTTLITTYPDPSPTVTGDLTTWHGRNPEGMWVLEVVDFGIGPGPGDDGQINSWSVTVDVFF